MGEVPSWYRLLKAAKYLEVAPWELARQPLAWVHRAEAAQEAEEHQQLMAAKAHQAQQGLR